jgi:hypothetical protein
MSDYAEILLFGGLMLFVAGALPLFLAIRRDTKPEREARKFVRDVNRKKSPEQTETWTPERKRNG